MHAAGAISTWYCLAALYAQETLWDLHQRIAWIYCPFGAFHMTHSLLNPWIGLEHVTKGTKQEEQGCPPRLLLSRQSGANTS
eukprot:1154472-Pelagomonas_calceolata.AAC.1